MKTISEDQHIQSLNEAIEDDICRNLGNLSECRNCEFLHACYSRENFICDTCGRSIEPGEAYKTFGRNGSIVSVCSEDCHKQAVNKILNEEVEFTPFGRAWNSAFQFSLSQ
ncbi:MAG: hypothetical protein WCJ37_02370 [Syntrophus sp. (in: bacteria)]|jgi:ribosomal protein L24E